MHFTLVSVTKYLLVSVTKMLVSECDKNSVLDFLLYVDKSHVAF